MISNLENLIEIFKKMSANGWEVDSELKWGFFFVDPEKDKLQLVFDEVKGHEYVLEKIFQLPNDDKWTLHISKIDVLNPEKLHKRNLAFNELALYCNVELYDGWDVEKLSN